MKKKNILILGAAGRDFHNFNTFFRNNNECNVVAFTAIQIPYIDERKYPAELAGKLYPNGIPIFKQENLEALIKQHHIDECVFSYSDVSYDYVMRVGAEVNAAGATFSMLGPEVTMIKSHKPVITVGAVRTGVGKSQTSRRIIEFLMEEGLKVVAIRHPMPYGNLIAQRVQRFAVLDDLKKHKCTIEEMEEYEPHIVRGNVIYAGVDYEAILRAAENDEDGCDVIVWDGGNNDFPFYRGDLNVCLVDPHRPGHELKYYPGEITLRMADTVIVNKVDSAPAKGVEAVKQNVKAVNPSAIIIEAESPITVSDANVITGKKVLVVEDGPTLTHGGMKLGAGTLAAKQFGADSLIDPRPYLQGEIKDTFEKYPDIGTLLPAMGYSDKQLHDLEETINKTPCDSVIIGTPIDLSRIVNIKKPHTRVFYDLKSVSTPNLEEVVHEFVREHVKT